MVSVRNRFCESLKILVVLLVESNGLVFFLYKKHIYSSSDLSSRNVSDVLSQVYMLMKIILLRKKLCLVVNDALQ